jgi:tRNA nucleotidyltransferase (CCA-adding enzyme)
MEAEENLEDTYYQSLKTSGLKVNEKLIKTKFKVLKETFEKILKKLDKEKKNNEEKILLIKIVAERIKQIEKLLEEENYFGVEIKIIGSFQMLLKI